MDGSDEWSPEFSLLCACARLRLREVDIERAAIASRAGVDWDALLTLADVHGLLPLLHRHAASGALGVATAPLAHLRERATAIVHRNLQLASELVALLRVCAEHNISVVPLKGLVLAQQIYGSVSLRRGGDLDLLFNEADIPAVARLLEQRGYHFQLGRSPERPAQELQGSHHLIAYTPARNVRVELHYCLVRPLGRTRWSIQQLGPRLQRASFMGTQVSVLPLEELLVYLCQHGATHAWSRLEWLAAVAELLNASPGLDWRRVHTFAREIDGTRRVSAAIMLARTLLATDVVAGTTTDRWIDAANRAVRHRLRREPLRALGTPIEHWAYLVRTDETWRARLLRTWWTLVAPTDADATAVPLPRVWRSLYYLSRPVRIAVRYGIQRALTRHPGSRRSSG